MATLFLDTSALVKLYFAEAGTAALERSASEHGTVLAISALGALEFRAAVRARVRQGALGMRSAEEALQHFAATVARTMLQQPLNDTVVVLGHALLDRHPLRAPDALQLASCIALHQSQRLNDLRFVCSDRALLGAAEEEGVPHWDPSRGERV